jgi:4-aminobutyrate aminotransferase-like enzyme
MVAGLATLEVLEEEDIAGQAREKGEYIKKRLLALQDKYEIIGEIRARGLMIAIELVKDRKTKEMMAHESHEMIEEAMHDGLLLGGCKYLDLASVLKIKPPAVITYEQIETVLEKFEKLIARWQDKITREKK